MYYRIRKKNERPKRNDYLCHYGVSIKNGAPGVGTGNWRRGGGSFNIDKQIVKSGYKKQSEAPEFTSYTKSGLKTKNGNDLTMIVELLDDNTDETKKKAFNLMKKIEKNSDEILSKFKDDFTKEYSKSKDLRDNLKYKNDALKDDKTSTALKEFGKRNHIGLTVDPFEEKYELYVDSSVGDRRVATVYDASKYDVDGSMMRIDKYRTY